MSSPAHIQHQSDSPQGGASLLAELQELMGEEERGGYRQWSDEGSWEKQGRGWGDVVREKVPHRAALKLLPEIKGWTSEKKS